MKEDLRVQKTKAALYVAFYNLLCEKSYEAITVNELCERANVRRATFYKHYRDKEDFLVLTIKKFRQDFDVIVWKNGRPTLTNDYFIHYLEMLINYMVLHSTLIEHIIEGNMREPFINIAVKQNYDDTLLKLKEATADGSKLAVSHEVAASVLVGGISHLLITWFERGRQTPVEKLKLDLRQLISTILVCEKV